MFDALETMMVFPAGINELYLSIPIN